MNDKSINMSMKWKEIVPASEEYTIKVQAVPLFWGLGSFLYIHVKKTRKLLKWRVGFHPKSSTLSLYTKEGGKGLMNIRDTTQDETSQIQGYIRKMAT